MSASVGAALVAAAASLRAAGIERPAFEARLLMAHSLGLLPGAVPDRDACAPAAFASLLARRVAREPMALILGRQGFWTLDLAVSPATLIPRADSEALIVAALRLLPDRAAVRTVLDLGTGTGALLLAALAEFPAAWGVGVDLSAEACALARGNARANGLADRSMFLCGDWAAALAGTFDLVLANPPYIPAGEIGALMPEVAAFEPRRALDGGADGLAAYRAIGAQLWRLLRADGVAVIELGAGQAPAVMALAVAAGLVVIGVEPDLGGIGRALSLRRPGRQAGI